MEIYITMIVFLLITQVAYKGFCAWVRVIPECTPTHVWIELWGAMGLAVWGLALIV